MRTFFYVSGFSAQSGLRFPIRPTVYFNDFGESRIPAPQINLLASSSGSHSPPPPHRIWISWKVVQPLAARHPEDVRGVKTTHRGDQPQALNNTLFHASTRGSKHSPRSYRHCFPLAYSLALPAAALAASRRPPAACGRASPNSRGPASRVWRSACHPLSLCRMQTLRGLGFRVEGLGFRCRMQTL